MSATQFPTPEGSNTPRLNSFGPFQGRNGFGRLFRGLPPTAMHVASLRDSENHLPPKPDSATLTNAALLGEFIEPQRIHQLPWLGEKVKPSEVPLRGRLRVVQQNLACVPQLTAHAKRRLSRLSSSQ